jgi:hypothetical protein
VDGVAEKVQQGLTALIAFVLLLLAVVVGVDVTAICKTCRVITSPCPTTRP